MKEKIFLSKICSIHANDLHFATTIFPFLTREIERDTVVRTFLERNEKENIEKILKNIGLSSEIKNEIRKIDWVESDIIKIRKNLKELDKDIKYSKDIDIIVLGSNLFIEKVNKVIELWVESSNTAKTMKINVINCFSMNENKQIDKILNTHDYMLKTAGVEKIANKLDLAKAN